MKTLNNKNVADLRNILAQLYPDPHSIRRIADDVGIDRSRIDFSASSLNIWHFILIEAGHINTVDALVDVVELEYGENPEFQRVSRAYRKSIKQNRQIRSNLRYSQQDNKGQTSKGYEHFGDVLNEYIAARRRSSGQLATLSGVPKQTIVSWSKGLVARPRRALDILRVARALQLDRNAVDRLLGSANYGQIEQVAKQEHGNDRTEIIKLLNDWIDAANVKHQIGVEHLAIPFLVPRPVRNFVGRDKLIEEVSTALRQREICALWGMSGIGKSELAKTLAWLLHSDFSDGVIWTDMSQVTISGKVDEVRLQEIVGNWLKMCGRPVGGDGDKAESLEARSSILRTILSQRQLLLILDNIHMPEEVEPFLPPQGSSSTLLITTTDRRTVRRYSRLFEVSSLSGAECQLLIQSYLGDARVNEEQENVATLAQQLEGHPLALSIVGSNLEESQELKILDYIELLRDEDKHHSHREIWTDSLRHTRTTIELSYRHLPTELRKFLLVLPLFEESDFDSAAVAAVTNESLLQTKQKLGRLCALTLVEELSYNLEDNLLGINKQATSTREKQIRYRLHSLFRLFAIEKAKEEGQETIRFSNNLIDHYMEVIRRKREYPFSGLQQDFVHIVRSLAWLAEQKLWELYRQNVHNLTAIQLGLAGFLDSRGHWSTALAMLHHCLADDTLSASPQALAEIYLKLAFFYERQGNTAEASAHLGLAERAMASEAMETANHRFWAYCYQLHARLRPAEALTWSQQALDQIRQSTEADARQEEGYLLIWHGSVLGQRGEVEAARAATQAGLTLLPPAANAARINGLNVLGILQELTGDTQAAIASWQQAMAPAKAMGDLRREGMLWGNIGAAESRCGRLQEAIVNKQVALTRYRAVGFLSGQIRTLSNLGEDYTLLLEFEKAQSHLAGAEALARSSGLQLELQWVLLNQVQLMLEQGDEVHEIAPVYNEAAGLQGQLQGKRQGIIGKRLAAELALRSGEPDQALTLARDLLEAAAGESLEHGLAYRLLGKVNEALGNSLDAELAYQQSITQFIDINPFEAARTQYALATHLFPTQQMERAQSTLDQVRDTFLKLNCSNHLTLVAQLQSTIGLSKPNL